MSFLEASEVLLRGFNCNVYPSAAAAQRAEEGGEERAAGQRGAGKKESRCCAPGSAPSSRSAAGACEERPAGWKQPGTSPSSSKAPLSKSAGHVVGSRAGPQTEVLLLYRCRWAVGPTESGNPPGGSLAWTLCRKEMVWKWMHRDVIQTAGMGKSAYVKCPAWETTGVPVTSPIATFWCPGRLESWTRPHKSVFHLSINPPSCDLGVSQGKVQRGFLKPSPAFRPI